MRASSKCAYKKCRYNNEQKFLNDFPSGLPKNYQFPCDKCDAVYHSENCREQDFKSGHNINCPQHKSNRNRQHSNDSNNKSFQLPSRNRLHSNDSNSNKIAQFEILLENDKCLGKGAFGYVTLVRNKKNMMVSAMKVVSKKFVDNHGGREI